MWTISNTLTGLVCTCNFFFKFAIVKVRNFYKNSTIQPLQPSEYLVTLRPHSHMIAAIGSHVCRLLFLGSYKSLLFTCTAFLIQFHGCEHLGSQPPSQI